MTYTPKPGDRVTSPLLVGEWEVVTVDRLNGNRSRLNAGSVNVFIDPADLTPVAPPLPPEPAVGEVVWAKGHLWIRGAGDWRSPTADYWQDWSNLAADAEPVVPVSRVAEWLREDHCSDTMADLFTAEFGWDK